MKEPVTAKSNHASETECNHQELLFPDLISRPVVVQMDGHRVSTDAGCLLVGELDRSFGITERFANSPTKDRKSTRLNSSHSQISYAVFCLKKKKKKNLI